VNAPSPLVMLIAGAVVLLMGFAVLVLARAGAADRRQARVAAVLDQHRAVTRPPASRFASLSRLFASRQGARVARLFGFEVDRVADYKIRWWIIPLVALPVARVLTGMAALLLGDIVLFATPLAWVMLSRGAFRWLDNQRMETLFRQFPDSLQMIVRAVRVGIPVTEAIKTVAREAPAQTGGGLSETLENLAEVIRKRVALKQRGLALASEARTSAGILAALPFVTGGALALINPTYIAKLFTDTGGQKILMLAVGMLGLGMFVMRSMIKRSLS